MIEIAFQSWDLLIEQIGQICVIPMLIVLAIWFINYSSQEHSTKEEMSRSVTYHYEPRPHVEPRPEPVIVRQKDMSLDVDRALQARVDTFVNCPYCGQKNKSIASSCEQCGGVL